MTVFVPIVRLMTLEHLHAMLVFTFNLYLMRFLMFSEIVCPREFLSTHSTMMTRDSRVLVVSGLMPQKLLARPKTFRTMLTGDEILVGLSPMHITFMCTQGVQM